MTINVTWLILYSENNNYDSHGMSLKIMSCCVVLYSIFRLCFRVIFVISDWVNLNWVESTCETCWSLLVNIRKTCSKELFGYGYSNYCKSLVHTHCEETFDILVRVKTVHLLHKCSNRPGQFIPWRIQHVLE